MRAFLIVLSVLLLGLATAGCGGDGDKASAPTTAAQQAKQDTATSTNRASTTESSERTTPADTRPSKTSTSGDATDTGSSSSQSSSDSNSLSDYKPAGSDDTQNATAAVIAFHMALATGNGDKACSLLSSAGRETLTGQLGQVPQLKGKSCGTILKQLTGSYTPQVRANLRNVTVTKLYIDGDSGLAKYRTGKLPLSVLPLQREGGSWKVAALGGAPADRVPLK
jgi:hypothetical protein